MTSPATVAKRHPIRALIWGLFVGIGVAIYLTFVFPVIKLESLTSAIVQMVVVAIVVAVLLTLLTVFVLPPKKPRGQPPAARRSPSGPTPDTPSDTPDNAE